jgi:CoA:oxalate CoA-transferase
MASITPFGQSGPYSSYRTYHVNQYHAGGATSGFYEGTEGRAPARGGGYIAEYDAGLTASVACMAALLAAEATGRGQHIDLSKQEASICIERVDIGRSANEPDPTQRWGSIGGLVATKDGHVVIIPNSSKHWDGLVEAMGDPDWAREEWCKDELARSENADRVQPYIKEWAAAHTRSEIYHGLQAKGTPAGSVLNTAEVRNWVQLQERGFFVDVEHPEAGTHAYAGTPTRFSTIKWSLSRAPLLGEHNHEVYCDDLGCKEEDLVRLAQKGVI